MTHRILLADDSATIRKVVELTFSDEDFAIDSVGDGAQAFEQARARRPDIVISDVIMPGMNGYELCQRFKTDPDLRSVPFLFLKGTFESFDEDKARACGADGFIVKPFESQDLIAKVKDLIGKAASAPAVTPPPPPRPDSFADRPLFQQRQAPAPPPIPSPPARPMTAPASPPARPMTAPASPPAMIARPAAPPIPPWPIRPVPVSPLPPPPPPVHQPPPPVSPIFQPPPPPPPGPPAAVPAPVDDFGFDFSEVEDERSGAPAAQSVVHTDAAPPSEPSGESDEDLWSEVSLRGSTGDYHEDRGHADSGVGTGADIVDLMEEAALIAPEVLFEDEAAFEEVSTARGIPLEITAAPPVAGEETLVTAASEPAVSVAPAAPTAIDQVEIERIVSARVEAAVRQILEPMVGGLARTMIESIAWEVIPDLAEAMIRAEIERVRQSTRTD